MDKKKLKKIESMEDLNKAAKAERERIEREKFLKSLQDAPLREVEENERHNEVIRNINSFDNLRDAPLELIDETEDNVKSSTNDDLQNLNDKPLGVKR